MKYKEYKHWEEALDSSNAMKTLVTDIIHKVVHNKIDGIQFSNLHPTEV